MRTSWVALLAAATTVAACSSGSGGGPAPSSGGRPAPSSGSSSPAVVTAGCPAGSSPDRAGDPRPARPAASEWFTLAAVDPTGPRIIVGETGFNPEGAGSSTLQSAWAFDVCTNTWTEWGDATLPPAEERPALGELVADPAAGVILGLPTGLAPVWRFDPTAGSWTALESSGGGSDMAWPTVVHDTDGDRLLAFDANMLTSDPTATGVLAYDLDTRARTHVDALDPEGGRPPVRMDRYDAVYDSAAQRLVLVITPEGSAGDPAQVWVFDPGAGGWTQGADAPMALPDGYHFSGIWVMAFEPVTERTWLFSDTVMLAYDARADEWTVADRGAGWPTSALIGGVEVDPMARLSGAMLVDPANGRLVVLGGWVRPVGDQVGGFTRDVDDLYASDDVWAYDPVANAWTLLLAASAEPASAEPG